MIARPNRSNAVADPTRERRSLLRALRWVAVTGAFAGAVLYSNWLLEIVFRRAADPDLFISELAAFDQPYGAWFRWGDRATAAVVGVAAAAGLARVGGSRWSRMGWWLVGVFAVATGLDSTVWNMVCAPSADAACAAREAAGAAPIGDQLHVLSSAIAVVASILSMIFFVMADRVEPTRTPIRRVGRYMVALLIGANIWTGIAFAIDPHGESGLIGFAQQAELIAMAGWLIYVALRTADAPATHTSETPADAATMETASQSSPGETLVHSFSPAGGSAAGSNFRHARVTTGSRPGWASNRPHTAAQFPAPAQSRRPARRSAARGVASIRSRIRGVKAVTVRTAFVPETKESDHV